MIHSLWWDKKFCTKNSALYDNLVQECCEKSEQKPSFLQASRLCLWQTAVFIILVAYKLRAAGLALYGPASGRRAPQFEIDKV
ncbi:hypothetical protein TE10_19660 [Raoultella ornithinolytica]|jgi:hypothetical protein|nr:hypothetical protein TE10_19660 [Raoultella ornithinolytica]HCR58574.1 hypothetical protein [Raoultella sp.]